MGKKGQRKPEDTRQNRITREIGIVPEDRVDVIVPDPPKGLLKHSKQIWERLWQSKLYQLVELDTDMESMQAYIGLVDEYERARRAFRKERVVEGSQGQPRLNPLGKWMLDLRKQIHQYEEAFGLTPQARFKLGIAFGEAQATIHDLNASLDNDEDDGEDLDDVLEVDVKERRSS